MNCKNYNRARRPARPGNHRGPCGAAQLPARCNQSISQKARPFSGVRAVRVRRSLSVAPVSFHVHQSGHSGWRLQARTETAGEEERGKEEGELDNCGLPHERFLLKEKKPLNILQPNAQWKTHQTDGSYLMPDKLKSRKFWLTVVGIIGATATGIAGGVAPATALIAAAAQIAAFVLGQSAVEATKAYQEGGK